MKQNLKIKIEIDSEDISDRIGSDEFEELEKSGKLANFMADIEDALWSDFFDEVDYFECEYGLG